jgi:hypothetical protein
LVLRIFLHTPVAARIAALHPFGTMVTNGGCVGVVVGGAEGESVGDHVGEAVVGYAVG